jgi:trans-aconitate methyltransferase
MTIATTTALDPVPAYNAAAAGYDARYTAPEFQAENRQIADWLAPSVAGVVVDLGCGTGLLLDILGSRISPRRFLGVDPSIGMLHELQRKHPRYVTMLGRAEDWCDPEHSADLIAALFGAASYIAPETLLALLDRLRHGGRLFLMAYKPGYVPDWLYGDYRDPQFDAALDALTEVAAWTGTSLREWHSFTILDVTV